MDIRVGAAGVVAAGAVGEAGAAAVEAGAEAVGEGFPAAAVVSGVVAQEVVGEMKTNVFLDRVEDEKVVVAIAEAESRTSGEIRVFITRQAAPDPTAAAMAQFQRLGMEKTRERNGVLIFVSPSAQTFAVVGDKAVHEKCGQEFWTRLAEEMCGHFRNAEYTQGLVVGIRTAGDLLALHFPRREDDRNELPDQVERD